MPFKPGLPQTLANIPLEYFTRALPVLRGADGLSGGLLTLGRQLSISCRGDTKSKERVIASQTTRRAGSSGHGPRFRTLTG